MNSMFGSLSSAAKIAWRVRARCGRRRAEVEEAAGRRRRGEVEGHRGGVFNVEEVAHLLAVPVVGSVGFEEADEPFLLRLRGGLVDERAHVGLVVFVGAVDVEVLEPDDLSSQPAPRVQVEEVLGVAVHVERPEGCSGAVSPSPGRRRRTWRRWRHTRIARLSSDHSASCFVNS